MLKVRFSALALAGLSIVFTAPSSAATLQEDFSSDPASHGWKIFGNTNLFQWDAANQNLRVTWDSSQPNSYFYLPLGTVLATNDDFSLEFDLQLEDASTEYYGSELAIGFLHFADATSTNFLRSGGICPNVAELDYFPPSFIAPSVDATLVDASTNFYFAFAVMPLDPATVYHVRLAHTAGQPAITGQLLTNGQVCASLTQAYGATMADFRLDMVTVSSYQDDGYGDTILAHGTVDNLVVTLPPPPVQDFTGALTNGCWEAQVSGCANWLYTLERSTDLVSWTAASMTAEGSGTTLVLQDTNAPAGQAFYRVRANRP
jgi:hypothetical protein